MTCVQAQAKATRKLSYPITIFILSFDSVATPCFFRRLHYPIFLLTLLITALPLQGELTIDERHGGAVTLWMWGGKGFIDHGAGATPSALALELADGEKAAFQVETCETSHSQEEQQWHLKGMLGPIAAELTYRYHEKAGRLTVMTLFHRPADPPAVKELRWQQKLALQPRKRIWFLGEHGVEWESRYFYQFFVGVRGDLLPRPDRNEWRWFGLDQSGVNAFRLWKAESLATSPLIMQEGRKALPALQCYDEAGGITLHMPGLAQLPAGRLLLGAERGGEANVVYHSRHELPFSGDAVYGVPHTFVLEADTSQEARQTKRVALQKGFHSPPPTPAEVMQEEPWLVKAPEQVAGPLYVQGGYPFARGELRDATALTARENGWWGKRLPVQAKALAHWPDGSVKWAHVTFPLPPKSKRAEEGAPHLSFRDGTRRAVSLSAGGKRTVPQERVEVTRAGNVVMLKTAGMEVELTNGKHWLQALRLGKESLLSDRQARLAYCDYTVEPTPPFPFDRALHGGRIDRHELEIKEITLEEDGPLRAVVRLEGWAGNEGGTRIILRITMLAGRPELQFTHSAHFLFDDPRKTYLTGMGLEIPLKAGKGVSFGGETMQDETGGTLLQSTPFALQLVSRQGSRFEVRDSPKAAPWLWKALPQGGVVAAIRDFRKQAPNALTWDGQREVLRIELWPDLAAPMDVRRYSEYPHRGQSESAGTEDDWVEKHYYPKGPFVGLSRTHDIFLHFNATPEQAEALAADWQSPPLLYAGWPRYESTGVALPASRQEQSPHAWQAWTNLTNFWLWHQTTYGWYGFWNHGNLRHYYRSGYGWIVPPERLKERLRDPSLLTRDDVLPDYRPPNDWAYDNGRWGWSNTEGLPNLFLQHEYLRHGNRAVYFASEAIARHSRDVVTRHEGPLLGKGTRHGVQAWSDGNHEERQTTVTEYRLHYFLSGDPRSRDVVEKLYREVYSQKPLHIAASHSGRLGGLLLHWEMTGDPEEGGRLQKYIEHFLSPEGLYLSPRVAFPSLREGQPRDELNGNTMFFHNFGAMHAMIEYYQITLHSGLKQSLIAMADAIFKDPKERQSLEAGRTGGAFATWPTLAFAARHASNPEPYRELIKTHLLSGGWRPLYQTVSANPEHWSGSTGFLRSNVPGSFFFNNWSAYLSWGVGEDEVWSKSIEDEIAAVEKNGIPTEPVPERWQGEYDEIPELRSYLSLPWVSPAQHGEQ